MAITLGGCVIGSKLDPGGPETLEVSTVGVTVTETVNPALLPTPPASALQMSLPADSPIRPSLTLSQQP
jgi:hypothetical protein